MVDSIRVHPSILKLEVEVRVGVMIRIRVRLKVTCRVRVRVTCRVRVRVTCKSPIGGLRYGISCG